MNPLQQLHPLGQSVWLDFIRRSLLESGELRRLVAEDGVRGVTSNPTIFDKAISQSTDYDDDLEQFLGANPDASLDRIYDHLVIADIQAAADALRSVYDESGGADGFVSLEVSPHLAPDTAGTIREARRLWGLVNRPNLMIKVPATPEGIPAFEELIASGINVNVTLMFSLQHYEAVAQAYLRGVTRCETPAKIASVASFFVSRVDGKVDKALEQNGSPEARALCGKAAIANAKLAYRRYQQLFESEAFAAQRARGARPQRCLWASTSTKNPAYPDTLYVDELIGPETVNTLPPETLEAFRDHGKPAVTLTRGMDEAERQIAALKKFGVDLDAVTEQLQVEGVASFAKSFDQLMGALKTKRDAVCANLAKR